MAQNKLTAARIKAMPPGKHGDGGGLWVKTHEDGRLSWTYRFRLNGRRREIGIPGGAGLTLSQARKARDELAAIVARGEDPLLIRKAAQDAREHTFESVANDTLDAKRAELKNARAIANWIAPLRVHVFPKLGNRPVTDLSGPLIRDALKPVWHERPEAARKALMRIGVVLKHAAAAEIEVDPFAADRAKLLLGAQMHRPKKTEAMPHADVPAFYQSLGEGPVELALRLLILTGLRSGPVRLLRDEHYSADLLTIPGENMKVTKKYEIDADYRVPLSKAAVGVFEVARDLYGRDGWVFVEPGRRQPLSYNTMPMHMKRRDLDFRPHGFRSSLNDWMRAEHGVDKELRELILQHRQLSTVASHYERDDLLQQRREVLDAWADYLGAS